MRETTLTHRRANIPAIVVGVFILLTAAFGLYYSATSTIEAFGGVFDPMLKEVDQPYFYHAFFIMTAICIFLLCGAAGVRRRFGEV